LSSWITRAKEATLSRNAARPGSDQPRLVDEDTTRRSGAGSPATGKEVETAGDGFLASFDGPACAAPAFASRSAGTATMKGVPGDWRLDAVRD
jgi:hypothetical protein